MGVTTPWPEASGRCWSDCKVHGRKDTSKGSFLLSPRSQTLERLLSQPTSPVLQRASLQVLFRAFHKPSEAYVDELELLSMQKEELLEEKKTCV